MFDVDVSTEQFHNLDSAVLGEDFRDLPNICAHPQATFHKPETSDLTYAPTFVVDVDVSTEQFHNLDLLFQVRIFEI